MQVIFNRGRVGCRIYTGPSPTSPWKQFLDDSFPTTQRSGPELFGFYHEPLRVAITSLYNEEELHEAFAGVDRDSEAERQGLGLSKSEGAGMEEEGLEDDKAEDSQQQQQQQQATDAPLPPAAGPRGKAASSKQLPAEGPARAGPAQPVLGLLGGRQQRVQQAPDRSKPMVLPAGLGSSRGLGAGRPGAVSPGPGQQAAGTKHNLTAGHSSAPPISKRARASDGASGSVPTAREATAPPAALCNIVHW